MIYKFKKFERDYLQGDAVISIASDNTIRFSAKFCRTTSILEFNYATLFFDEKNLAIGILPTKTKERGSFTVTKERFSASISASSFMKANNLNPKTYHGQYGWTQESIIPFGKLFIVNLKDKR